MNSFHDLLAISTVVFPGGVRGGKDFCSRAARGASASRRATHPLA